MRDKQTIIINDKEEDDIVTLSDSISSYVDSTYFNKKCGEDPK